MCVAGAGTLVAGRYRLQSRIAAAGDREEAWRADDLARGCPVAVRLSTAGPPGPADDFLAAARAAAQVCHPGIMRILDYGQAGTDGIPFLVTELAETASVAVVLEAGEHPRHDRRRPGIGLQLVRAPPPRGVRLVRVRPRVPEPAPVRRTPAQVPALLQGLGRHRARAFLDGAGPAAIGAILGSAITLARAATSLTPGTGPARTTLAIAGLAQTVALLAGALSVTSEFRHKTITPLF